MSRPSRNASAPLARALALSLCAFASSAQAQFGGGGMRPMGQPAPTGPAGPEKEQAAEAAPEAAGQEPALQPLPAWPGQREKSLQFFQLHGYLRGRAYYFHQADLGIPFATSGVSAPYFYVPYSEASSIANCTAREGSACSSNNITSADMRLRLEPVINVSDQVRVKAQIDIFDNLVAGSTPEGFFTNGLSPTADVPLAMFSRTQTTPTFGLNSFADSIRVKRAWAEVKIPIGELRFGRMPDHWGTGMFINDGNCLDCDFGRNVDRVMFATKLWNHFALVAWDWVSSGPTTALFNQNFQQGQAYNADPLDDVQEVVVALGRQDKPEELRERVERGDVVINYGGYFIGRWQSWDQVSNPNASTFATDPNTAQVDLAQTLTHRDAWAFVPDLWFRLNWRKLHIEAEGVMVYGKIGNVTDQVLGTTGATVRRFGGVLKADYRLLRDALQIAVEVGTASGDPSEDPSGRVYFQTAAIQRPATQTTITNFMFDPDYHVDLILWRRIVGAVTNATYMKAGASYDILDSLTARADVIYSLANTPVGWPGNSINLGLEIDASLMYHNDEEGFYAGIAYGVLFPFAALSFPTAIYNNPSGSNIDPQTAQTVQGRLLVRF